jgi:hypothetical protein
MLIGMKDPQPPSTSDGTIADVIGQFDVKYELVASNCDDIGIALTCGSLTITRREANMIAVDIAGVPTMVGSALVGGRVRAMSKLDEIGGVDSQSSITGAVGDGILSMELVAEYYVQGRPSCTQTWNVSGQRVTST